MSGSALRLALRLARAHHPLCDRFDADVVGKGRWCSGCVAAWPSFLLTVPGAWLALQMGADAAAFVVSGLVLGVPQLASAFWRGGRAMRMAVKILGGVGLGLLTMGGLGMSVAFAWKVIAAVVLGAAALLLQALRMRAILRRCDSCVWRRDWERCPGMLAHS